MTRRAAPLLADRLPLYATRDEIAATIVNSAGEQKFARAMLDWPGFPAPSPLLGGRYYVPAVLEAIDAYARKQGSPSPPDGNEGQSTWKLKRPGRRASSTGR